jgi:hypothetical protein
LPLYNINENNFLFLALCFTVAAQAQSVNGYWYGSANGEQPGQRTTTT